MLLDSEEVEMLGVLRINRPFMEKIRSSTYAQEALQQYNMTVVDLEDDASAPAPSTPAPASGAGPSHEPVEI